MMYRYSLGFCTLERNFDLLLCSILICSINPNTSLSKFLFIWDYYSFEASFSASLSLIYSLSSLALVDETHFPDQLVYEIDFPYHLPFPFWVTCRLIFVLGHFYIIRG